MRGAPLSGGGSILSVGKHRAPIYPLFPLLCSSPCLTLWGEHPHPRCPPGKAGGGRKLRERSICAPAEPSHTPRLPLRLLPALQKRARSAERPPRTSLAIAPAEFLRTSVSPSGAGSCRPLPPHTSPSLPARGVRRWEGRTAIHLDLFQFCPAMAKL